MTDIAAAGERESSLGITEYLTPGPGFTGITKQRYAIPTITYTQYCSTVAEG